jgi:hypothetical protein
MVRRDFGTLAALVSGLATLFNPMLISTWGGEWLVAMAAFAGAMVAWQRDRLALATLALAVAVIFRNEAALGAGLVSVALWLRHQRGAIVPLAVAVCAGLGWMLVLWAVTGHVLPATFGAKLAHGQSGLFGTVLAGAPLLIVGFSGAGLLMAPLALLAWHGGLVAALAPGVWKWLLGWVAVHLVFYQVLRMPLYHWYLVPLVYTITLMTGPGAGAAADYVRRLVPATAGRVLALGLALALAGTGIWAEWKSARAWMLNKPHAGEQLYNDVARWLADNTARDASVAYLEIGRIGYYSDRRIIDQMGLVTPEAIEQVRRRNLTWVINAFKPDYYLVHSAFTWAGAPLDEPWFRVAYEPVTQFHRREFNVTLTVYRLRDASAIPAAPTVQALQPKAREVIGEILAGVGHAQTFVAPENGLTAVATQMATFARRNTGPLRVRIEQVEPHEVLFEQEFDMAEVADNEWRAFRFDPVAASGGRTYRISLDAPSASPGNAVTVWYEPRDRYAEGERYVGGRAANGDWTLRLTYRRTAP